LKKFHTSWSILLDRHGDMLNSLLNAYVAVSTMRRSYSAGLEKQEISAGIDLMTARRRVSVFWKNIHGWTNAILQG